MSYVFLLILLFPVKLIRKLFRKDTGKKPGHSDSQNR